MTINKLRETQEFRQALEQLANFFATHPDIQAEVKKLSYFQLTIVNLRAIKDAGPLMYDRYNSRGNIGTYHLFEEFYAAIVSYYPLINKVAETKRNTLLTGLIIATLTGSILDHTRVFNKRAAQWSLYACVQNNVSINKLRNLLKYEVGDDFLWHKAASTATESTLRFFKENEVPAKYYWRMCATITPYAFNPILFRYAFQDVRKFCEVKDTPEHKALAAGAANRLNNKYYPLGIITTQSLTDYIRAANNKSEAIEQLLQLCRDTERMHYEVPGNCRYRDPRLKLSIKEIRAEHDRLIPLYNAELARRRIEVAARNQQRITERDVQLAKLNEPIQELPFAPKELFTEDYKVILPKTRTEIVDEGAAMGHCVASYAGRHACKDAYFPGTRYMFIMFARTLDDERIATVEVEYTETDDLAAYSVKQIRGKFNKTNELINKINADLFNHFNTNK